MQKKINKRENQGPAKLVEEAKHGDGFGEFEARVSILQFANKFLRDVYTIYRREGHFSHRERELESNPSLA